MGRNIVLTGFMGTGKTEVSKIIAERLKRQRLCLDDMIEWKTGKPIPEIFAQDGEEYFRKTESEIVAAAAKNKNAVIDAGGGAIIDENNLRRLKETGVVFCLSASADTILERTRHYTHRPLLNVKNPLGAIINLLKKRQRYYSQADSTIDTANLTPEQVADKVIAQMEALEKDEPSPSNEDAGSKGSPG